MSKAKPSLSKVTPAVEAKPEETPVTTENLKVGRIVEENEFPQ